MSAQARVSTRDAEAQARDGQAFYALNPMESQAPEVILEIQFDDSSWMLAVADDLEMTSAPPQATPSGSLDSYGK
jgi:hypothetical protein